LTKQCTLCASACSSCVTSANNCQSCQSVNGIAYYLSGSLCTVSCPVGQYGNLTNFQCLSCANGCSSCSGGSLFTCLSCKNDLFNGNSTDFFLIYGTTTCNPICPNGQYSNSSSFKCLLCDINCLTCVNTSTICLTCGFSSIGANLFLYQKSCLLSCPLNFFPNSTTSTCDPCH